MEKIHTDNNFFKGRQQNEWHPSMIFNFSSALAERVDEYVSENRCKTLPPYSVVSLQEENDMSEPQVDLCTWRLLNKRRTSLYLRKREGGVTGNCDSSLPSNLQRTEYFSNHTYPNWSWFQFYLSYYLYDSQGCHLLTIWSWAHFLTFLCLSFFIHEMGIIIVLTL